jgi:hypothetical protein
MKRGLEIGDKKERDRPYKKLGESDDYSGDGESWFDWQWFHTKTGFYFTWLIALTILAVTAVILAGVLWKMRGGTFECIASPLLSGEINVAGESLDVFQIVNMAATSMEFESALTGTRLEKCVDFCKKSFNIGEYACNDDFCNVCHISAFDSYSSAPYTLCIKSCECCMENKCTGSCESFVSNHACGFKCQDFGYSVPTTCA